MGEQGKRTDAQVGDVVAIHGHHVGEPERLGEILDVLGAPGNAHYRVRWDDEHESIFYPGNDATIRMHDATKEGATP